MKEGGGQNVSAPVNKVQDPELTWAGEDISREETISTAVKP